MPGPAAVLGPDPGRIGIFEDRCYARNIAHGGRLIRPLSGGSYRHFTSPKRGSASRTRRANGECGGSRGAAARILRTGGPRLPRFALSQGGPGGGGGGGPAKDARIRGPRAGAAEEGEQERDAERPRVVDAREGGQTKDAPCRRGCRREPDENAAMAAQRVAQRQSRHE